ncbi:hypothetical protein [Mesorhizobium sp. WSM2561]|uniref:hypothetical protein n=1 Tax=Mesorhizobium sp. WSM2561 TaxID=1040985 RepID=UPI00048325E1|nr:hypothetical protein [Mesorhizobium sp. WSM2561]
MSAPTITCKGCGASFTPSRPDQHCCNASCRAKAQRRRQRRADLGEVQSSDKNVRAAPRWLPAAVGRQALADPTSTSPKPCIRPGYPVGIIESRDELGLPVFFDEDGKRLIRNWGPGGFSDVERRVMKLQLTELTFFGGRFYRRDGSGHEALSTKIDVVSKRQSDCSR